MATEITFFSYSRTDSDFVLKLAKDLRKAGAELWIDQLDIKPGSHWDSSVELALNAASRLIIILSPASVSSNNVMDEVAFALESHKSIIPVLMSECTTPFRLRRLQHIDFTGDYQQGLGQLLEALGHTNKGINNEEEIDKELWEEATSINSVSSYKKYINESPIGLQKEKALELIKQIESQKIDIDPEKTFWEKVNTNNTLIGYTDYLEKYPKGKYSTEVLSKIKMIRETEKQNDKTIDNPNIKRNTLVGVFLILLLIGIWALPKYLSNNSNSSKAKVKENDTNVKKITPPDNTIAIGSKYQGGIIFYIDPTGQHGLIAAYSDQGKEIQWDNGSNKVTGAKDTRIGAGSSNTIAIIKNGEPGKFAARYCSDLDLGGFNDWYLPSKDELNMLYQNKEAVGGFDSKFYWSSSEDSLYANVAWIQDFTDGYQKGRAKSFGYNVRAIRSF